MLIDGVLSDGLAIMAGDSKIGKSWMVLWMCLQISKGEPVWGLPTRKTDVVYLALEDREWRVQQRMQDLTDNPPDNLHFGFSCGRLGAELESQIEDVLKDYPSTRLLFIDTLQMVRDNVSAKVNAYAQDYKDLSALKKIADNHGICIFVVHHTRKERDGGNIFNDMTGSTGIMGVADTVMILRKDDRFGDNTTLCITGRDVEEKKLKMQKPSSENPTEINKEINKKRNNQELTQASIDSVPSGASREGSEDEGIWREIITENLESDIVREESGCDPGIVDDIVELMVETVCSTRRYIRVGKEDKPAAAVKSRLLKLERRHLEYVLWCMGKNTTEVRNIRAYLLTALYNSYFSECSGMAAQVQHDLYGKGGEAI